jgi:WD repeat and SOF domain-containing protein 1
MVKLKAICRDQNDYKRRTNTEIEKVYRNSNPSLHPFQKAKEYVRALNAVKLERVFAKPFLFSLNEHTDGVKCLAKNYKNLSELISGSFDGQVILWNINNRKPIYNIRTSHDFVKGLCFSNSGDDFLTCGDDNVINLYKKSSLFNQKENNLIKYNERNTNNTSNINLENNGAAAYKPSAVYQTDAFLESIDHSYGDSLFATAGGVVAIWNYERNIPLTQFKNVSDGFIRVKFNPVENHIVLATGYDRSINLYDLRTNNPLKSVSMRNKSSAGSWNPQEPFNFTIGNEDSNLYTYDMRKLEQVKIIHKDHILAV